MNGALPQQTYWYIPFDAYRRVPLVDFATAYPHTHPPYHLTPFGAAGLDTRIQCARGGESSEIGRRLCSMTGNRDDTDLRDHQGER